MKSLYPAACLLSHGALAQYLEPPPTATDPTTIDDCSYWHIATSGETCASIAATYGLTLQQFELYNPSVAGSCSLIVGNSYCVEQNYGIPVESTSSLIGTPTITQSSGSPATTTGVVTPTPIQDGMVKNCDKFHLVQDGELCTDILSIYGISLADLFTWNPAVGSRCTNLWANTYVCVGVIGGSTTGTITSTTASFSSTTTGNGITTPTPTQAGMTKDCNKFHFVSEGDGCYSIGEKYGVTLAQLYAWNPAIGSNCNSLWLNTYLCVGVIGGFTTFSTSTTTSRVTSTSTGNGITTPTPTQPGMASNCDQFHLVVSEDECATIVSTYGIPLETFYSWNKGVGNNCQSLWLDTYVCVHTIGYVKPTPTTTAGGVATPTPFHPGMVSGCTKFHKVVSGDYCAAIAATYGISVSDFYNWNPGVGNNCQSLWLNTYYCVGRG